MTSLNLAFEPAPVKLDQPPQIYIPDSQLCARWHMSKVSLWRKRREDPRMPRPVKGIHGWQNLSLLVEIEAYEQLLLAQRDAEARSQPPRKRSADAKAGPKRRSRTRT